MIVLSHRGLDLERREQLAENSLAAFRWAATQGFGIELDLQITKESELIVAHDATTEHWSQGKVKKNWFDLSGAELAELENNWGPLCRLKEALGLANEFPSAMLAIHLKGQNQNDTFTKALAKSLLPQRNIFQRILIFDLKVSTAGFLRKACPGIGLAPSVAHAFDVQRFQSVAHGTLFAPQDILGQDGPYNWVWLDEWDRAAVDGKSKALYEETITTFQNNGFMVAVISPELHKAEKHQDAESLEALEKRWREILKLKPHAVCTDYPARFSAFSKVG